MVRALASYQCGSGSYTGLLLVIILAPRASSNVFPFPDARLRKFQTFPNSISIRNQRGIRLFIRKGLLSVTLTMKNSLTVYILDLLLDPFVKRVLI